ncbi:ATP-binding cassette domain-containing protein [Methylosinus sporium]|uniref:phosphatase domain-containing putative toxin n=1 Tax=Methylosinus sporium TaxID=428 RepID=UPI00383A5937
MRCRHFGAAFGSRVILADVSLCLPSLGVTVLMGPAGTGKSTLLRSLAALFGNSRMYKCWGEAVYLGAPISPTNAPALVGQHINLTQRSVLDSLLLNFAKTSVNERERRAAVVSWLAELGAGDLAIHFDRPYVDLEPCLQRKVAILREAAGEPSLLMIDEPTSGLSDDAADDLLRLIEHIARRCAVLVVLHNLKQARRVARDVVLLAGGRVIEQSPTAKFFASKNSVTEIFVSTGSCAVPAPDASPDALVCETLAPPPLPEAAREAVAEAERASSGQIRSAAISASGKYPWLTAAQPWPGQKTPRLDGFRWIIPGRLAGVAGPGVVNALDYDLDLLRRAGVTTLITLTESNLPQPALAAQGLQNLHLPIPDGCVPSLEDVQALVGGIRALVETDHVVAVHCLEGVGRTGTILACCFIDGGGMSASEALAHIRKIDPKYVRSEIQERFLSAYDRLVDARCRSTCL